LLILTLSFITPGCNNKNKIPNSVLSQKKMQGILWDLMRADQFLNDYVLNNDTSLNKTTESLKYYQQIFAIHKTTREEFQHSFSFYKSHPSLLRSIMDSISTRGSESASRLARPDSVPIPIPIAPVQDTVTKNPVKIIQDTTTPQKRKRPLLPN